MKHSIAYIIDVAGDIDPDFKANHQIYTLPCAINFKDGQYIAEVTIDRETLIKKMEEEVPTTSTCSLDYLEEILQDIRKRGIENVLLVTMGNKFSSLHGLVQLYSQGVEDLNIYCLNSQAISFAEGAYLIRAIDLESQGYSFEEICRELEKMKEENPVLLEAYVQSLDYLLRGGRIKKTSAAIGNVLNIRPILTLEDGILVVQDKVRGEKKSLNYVKKKIQDYIRGDKKYYLAVLYGQEKDKDRLEELFKEDLEKADYSQIGPFSPIVLVHSGPEIVGIFAHVIDEEKGLNF